MPLHAFDTVLHRRYHRNHTLTNTPSNPHKTHLKPLHNQALAYVERLCTGPGGPAHAAMFVAKPDFFTLLGNVIKTSKNVALRVQALHVGGLLLRHAPDISIAISESVFVTQAVEDAKQQQVCRAAACRAQPSRPTRPALTRVLQGGDVSLRRRAVAALSELVFYGAAECMSRRDCISLPSGFLLVRPAKLPFRHNLRTHRRRLHLADVLANPEPVSFFIE